MAAAIVRSWRGVTTRANVAPYLEHLRRDTIPQLETLRGYRGMQILRRDVEDGVEFLVQTTWQSFECIRAFAGDDLAVAVVPPPAQAVLSRFDPHVEHYEVVEEARRQA